MATKQREPEIEPLAVLGIVAKNNRENIRISIDEYQGHRYVDIRIGVPDDGGRFVKTNKGAAIPLRRLPAVIDLLTAALAEARRRHLFDGGI